MPAGLIKEDNGVRSEGDFGCDLVEMELHGFAVASRQHEGGAGSTFGTDRTKHISRLGPLGERIWRAIRSAAGCPDLRSGRGLWRCGDAPIAGHGHPRQAHCPWLALAKRLRREADWVDPA